MISSCCLGVTAKAIWIKSLNHGNLAMFSFWPNSQSHQQILPQVWWNTEKPHKATIKKCVLYKKSSQQYSTKKAMYMDQTGCFPITTSSGNKYKMVPMELDDNYINAEPMKLRSTCDLINACQAIWKHWSATRVISPNWHILDNEAPNDFKVAIWSNWCKIELVPPETYHQNMAEQDVQTHKNQFILVLLGVDDSFSIYQ